MATVSELVVLVNANTAGFQKGMATAAKTTSGFSAVAKAGFAIAAVAAVKFAADAIESYNDHQDALLKLQNTIDNSPQLVGASIKAFEDQATALQNLTGVQDEEILRADALLGRFQLTADQIQKLNPLILDYARATGTDAESAADRLGKAMLGNARALKALGIDFDATGNRAKDFNTISGLLEEKVGGLAKAYGKTLPGQLDIAAAKFDDVKETVGAALIPILQKLLDLARPLIGVLKLASENLDIVVAAGLGFAAWKFIPPLLTAIAVGLDRIGFTALGVGILEVSGALTTAVPPAVAFGAAFAGITAATAAWDPLQLAGDADELRESMSVHGVVLGRVARSTDLVGESSTKFGDKLQDVEGQTKKTAAEQAVLSAKIDAVTFSMEEQKDAAQQLAGGMLGLVSSAKDLAEKQRLVNHMQEVGKDSGKKYNDAVLDLLVSQEDFNDQLRDYRDELETAGLSSDDAKQKVINLGKSLGLTKDDVLAILRPLKEYRDELERIPRDVTTNVTTVFRQQGDFPNRKGLATGGIVTRPTVALIGEAGPEAVIPLDKANQMGFGGWGGDIVLQVDGQTFARITRDQLRKLGNRNAGTGL